MSDHIIIAGLPVEVPFRTRVELGHLPTRSRRGEVCQVILHHDACLSADQCRRVLLARKLSTHFCVDNDGTCVQCEDPGAREAWHAVGRVQDGGEIEQCGFNRHSVGIDISNAVVLGRANRYKPPREQGMRIVHGAPMRGLLPYPCQIETTLALLRVLRAHFPGVTAAHRDEARWYGDLRPDTPGVYGHMQISPAKCDPFGFPFERLVEV